MKLSQLKNAVSHVPEINFELPDGSYVPKHFHITEIGETSKKFIDCGGTVRHEKMVSLQLWEAGDTDHRLAPEKLSGIIALSEKVLAIEDAEVEVEYQTITIGKYGLNFNGKNFLLIPKNTACLASDACGNPEAKQKIQLADLAEAAGKTCCTPGGGCC